MRLPRIALLGLLLLLALAGAILFADETGEVGGEARTSATDGRTEAGTADLAAGAPGDATAAALDRTATPTDPDAAAGVLPFAGPRLVVRVLDWTTREPIPNATVWVFDADAIGEEALARRAEEQQDWEDAAPELATRHLADARGELQLPQPRDWYRLIGRKESRYGEAYVEAGGDGAVVRLLLEPDVSLRARVVDAGGAGVPGAVVGLRSGERSFFNWFLTRTTDAEGRAVFPHMQRWTTSRSSTQVMQLALAMPSAEPPHLVLDPYALPAEECVLRLPAHGSVLVRLLDQDRKPVRPGARAVLQARFEGDEDFMDEDEFQQLATTGSRSIRLAEGNEALFPHVGLGQRLMLGVDFENTMDFERTDFDGPVEAGQQVVIEVLQQRQWRRLRARLLDDRGEPLREKSLALATRMVAPDASAFESREVRTDAEGVVMTALEPHWVQVQANQTRQLEFLWQGPEGQLLGAAVPLASTWSPGITDAGDLRLAPVSLLAGGQVLDDAGRPIAGARVALQLRTLRRNRESWREDPQSSERTDAEGRFALHGLPRTGTFRLSVAHGDYSGAVEPCRLGAADHLVTLRAGRYVAGRLLLAPQIPWRSLQILGVPPGTPLDQEGRGTRGSLSSSGDFRVGPTDLPLVDLWLWDQQLDRVLTVVRDVLPGAPDAAPDPRLDPLDLRGQLRLVFVRCFGPDGRVLDGDWSVSICAATAEEPHRWITADPGPADIPLLSMETGDVAWARMQGFRATSGPIVGDRADLVLTPGPRVRWSLADGRVRDLTTEGMWFEVSWTDEAGEQESVWHAIDAAEPMALDRAGEYFVRLAFRWTDAEGRRRWVTYPREPRPVDVLDRSGVQEVVLPWTVEEVRAGTGMAGR